MKHYMIHIEEINGNGDDKKVYIVNEYQKDKIDKIIEDDKEEEQNSLQ